MFDPGAVACLDVISHGPCPPPRDYRRRRDRNSAIGRNRWRTVGEFAPGELRKAIALLETGRQVGDKGLNLS